MDDPWFLVGL